MSLNVFAKQLHAWVAGPPRSVDLEDDDDAITEGDSE